MKRPSERALEVQRQAAFLLAVQNVAQSGSPEGASDHRHMVAAHGPGVDVYRSNAWALAPRVLQAAFPTVAALFGQASFEALSRVFWQTNPPLRGDMGWWGAALPDFLANDSKLVGDTYLADMARLDWAIHRAGNAADDQCPPEGLTLLGRHDPVRLRLALRAGTAVVSSRHPIVTLWEAHQPDTTASGDVEGTGERPSWHEARTALQGECEEAALVTRGGSPRVSVWRLDRAGARFAASLLENHNLELALIRAGSQLDLSQWLISALRRGAIAAVRVAGPEVHSSAADLRRSSESTEAITRAITANDTHA